MDTLRRLGVDRVMAYIARANRLRLFNTALGLHEHDLDTWPVDFVEVVTEWQRFRESNE